MRLTELRADDLRFTSVEAAAFLDEMMGPDHTELPSEVRYGWLLPLVPRG